MTPASDRAKARPRGRLDRARKNVGRLAIRLLSCPENGFVSPVHVTHLQGPYWVSVERSILQALLLAATTLEWEERQYRKKRRSKNGGDHA
jgi:hypothetical protein